MFCTSKPGLIRDILSKSTGIEKNQKILKTLVCTWGQQNTMNQGLFDISSRYLITL